MLSLHVAIRTNALCKSRIRWMYIVAWESQPARMRCGKSLHPATLTASLRVATRTNALWQIQDNCGSVYTQPCRNPHECAVAKFQVRADGLKNLPSQPARMRCGKDGWLFRFFLLLRRNPRECAVAKSRHCYARTGNSESMNYVLHF